ncbi:hypothetical protein PUN28_003161 [Cardiocondyla obscurior]|uniref:Uncharacterized protein n=1 Tax=Cardiocondyla obscurior TaxID=286306 RepID=A0AAW2GI32_9HYME
MLTALKAPLRDKGGRGTRGSLHSFMEIKNVISDSHEYKFHPPLPPYRPPFVAYRRPRLWVLYSIYRLSCNCAFSPRSLNFFEFTSLRQKFYLNLSLSLSLSLSLFSFSYIILNCEHSRYVQSNIYVICDGRRIFIYIE